MISWGAHVVDYLVGFDQRHNDLAATPERDAGPAATVLADVDVFHLLGWGSLAKKLHLMLFGGDG